MNRVKSVVDGTGCPEYGCRSDCIICGILTIHDTDVWQQHREKIKSIIVEQHPKLDDNLVEYWTNYIMANCNLSNFLEVIAGIGSVNSAWKNFN